MSNVILSAIVVLLCVSCSSHQNKNVTAKAVISDSLVKKDTSIQPAASKQICETCSDKNTPPVWYIWDSKRFFW